MRDAAGCRVYFMIGHSLVEIGYSRGRCVAAPTGAAGRPHPLPRSRRRERGEAHFMIGHSLVEIGYSRARCAAILMRFRGRCVVGRVLRCGPPSPPHRGPNGRRNQRHDNHLHPTGQDRTCATPLDAFRVARCRRAPASAGKADKHELRAERGACFLFAPRTLIYYTLISTAAPWEGNGGGMGWEPDLIFYCIGAFDDSQYHTTEHDST